MCEVYVLSLTVKVNLCPCEFKDGQNVPLTSKARSYTLQDLKAVAVSDPHPPETVNFALMALLPGGVGSLPLQPLRSLCLLLVV